MTTIEQIKIVLAHTGLKITPFCKEIDVDRHVVADIYYGRVAKISTKLANAIVTRYPEFNLVWLLTKTGEPLADKSIPLVPETTDDDTTTDMDDYIASLQSQIEELKKDKEHLKMLIDKLILEK